MAEIVQMHLESFLPELEQMETTGLFSSDELKKIIKKRKALEYVLRRRTKTKEDYLKYIQYETTLLSLISKRRKRLGCRLKKKEIDHSIATRINKLFKAVIARHQNDEKLWLTQIQFCQRMKWNHAISSLFTRMLQVHNDKPELWVLAAKWEFEENNAPENARRHLQQSLKFHGNSRLLWTEYFRMELMYTEKVQKRQQILDYQGVRDAVNDDVVLQAKIPFTVYKKAVKEIPDADFAVSLIEICRKFDFTHDLIDHIYQDMQARWPWDEVTLNAVARRPLSTLDEELKKAQVKGVKKARVTYEVEERVCALYEKALEKMQTEKMWSYYIEFALGRCDDCKNEKRKSKLLGKALKLMEQASSADLLSADLYVQWHKILEEKGDDSCCLVALEGARKWPKKVSLWVLCLNAHMKTGKENFSSILDEAMRNVSAKKSLPIWKLGMQWLSVFNPSELKNYFEKGIQNREIRGPVKEMYLEATALTDGIEAARQLYKKIKSVSSLTPDFIRKMISIENAQLKPSIKFLRRYHEDAVHEFGECDEDFWLSLIQLEHKHPEGDVSNIQMYHWRAIKTLGPEKEDAFTAKYTLMKAGHKVELFSK